MEIINSVLAVMFNYNTPVMKKNSLETPTKKLILVVRFVDLSEKSKHVSLWYVKGTSECIHKTITKYDILVEHKPNNAARKLLSKLKLCIKAQKQSTVVYKMNCAYSEGTYIGKTK